MTKPAWIITPGAYTNFDVAALGIKAKPKRVMEYGLSDIGRYLIHPGPIEVDNVLVGCECDRVATGRRRARRFIDRALAWSRKSPTGAKRPPHVFLARNAVKIPVLKDRQLASHIERLRGILQPLDPAFQEIEAIDLHTVDDIRGICEDEAGHRTLLTLKGDVAAKRRYVLDHLLKPVRMTLSSVHIGEGLFEMRGWNRSHFAVDRIHRLLRFHVDGKFFACLLNADNRMVFWINDIQNLQRMFLLQQAMDTSPRLAAAMNRCLLDDARPMRLMFNPDIGIDYSRNRIPPVYQELFRTLDLDREVQRNVIQSLNRHQLGVSFSYVEQTGFGDPQPVTNISVMHDVKALEPLRAGAPEVLAAIARRVAISEAGKYYLLEDIQGQGSEIGA